MSIRETFSKLINLAVIIQYDKGAVMQISVVLGHVYHILVEGFSETGLFRHLSNYVFGVRNFDFTKSMRVIFFFKMFKILTRF